MRHVAQHDNSSGELRTACCSRRSCMGFNAIDTNGIDTLGCVWDTGPEFVPGDNSTVEVTVRDVTFAEFLGDDPAGWAADVSGRVGGR